MDKALDPIALNQARTDAAFVIGSETGGLWHRTVGVTPAVASDNCGTEQASCEMAGLERARSADARGENGDVVALIGPGCEAGDALASLFDQRLWVDVSPITEQVE